MLPSHLETALCPAGRLHEVLQKQEGARLPRLQGIPVWIPGVLPDHVWQHHPSDVAGGIRREKPDGGHQAAVDVPGTVGLGVYRRHHGGLGGAVLLRLLQPDADLDDYRPCGDGAVQAAHLAHLLPHGHDDADDLQDSGTSAWALHTDQSPGGTSCAASRSVRRH